MMMIGQEDTMKGYKQYKQYKQEQYDTSDTNNTNRNDKMRGKGLVTTRQ
jgi:hypothetical protein